MGEEMRRKRKGRGKDGGDRKKGRELAGWLAGWLDRQRDRQAGQEKL